MCGPLGVHASSHPLTWRLDFTGAGAPHTDCQWVIWEGLAFETSFQPLQRPDALRQKDLKQADGPLLMIATETDRNAGNVLPARQEEADMKNQFEWAGYQSEWGVMTETLTASSADNNRLGCVRKTTSACVS